MIVDAKDAAVGAASLGAAVLGVAALMVAAVGVAAAGRAAVGKAAGKESAAAMEMDQNGHLTLSLSLRRLALSGMTRIPIEAICGCDGFGSSLCDNIPYMSYLYLYRMLEYSHRQIIFLPLHEF